MANIKSDYISLGKANLLQKIHQNLKFLILFLLMFISPFGFSQAYITNGVGEYLEFNEATLLVRLELETPAGEAIDAISLDTNKKLSFRILKDKSPRLWSRIWIQNLSINNSPTTITTQTDDLIAMTQAIKGTLKTGDLVEFERIADDLVLMNINGIEVKDLETPGFFEFLLSALIGNIPPSSELKANLLSAGDIDNAVNLHFDSYNANEERIASINTWVTPAESEPEPEPEPIEVLEPEPAVVAVPEPVVVAVPEPPVIPEPEEPIVIAEPEPEPEPIEDDAPIIITAESLLAAQNYQRSVLTKVYQNIKYPQSELRKKRDGSLRIAISIGSRGNLVKAEITQNARFSNFDEAAIEAVEDASPFEPLPEGTLEVPMVLEIPITFKLN